MNGQSQHPHEVFHGQDTPFSSEGGPSINDLIAMLGHELRNPLAAIRSAVEVLHIRGSQTSQTDPVVAVLDRQSAHMTRFVDGLLDVARLTKGRLVLALKDVDLRTVVKDAVFDMTAQIHHRGLALQVNEGPDPLVVRGDVSRLAQVFGNLLENATKYTNPPGAIIVSSCKNGDEAVVVIKDTGRGIRPELLARVFEGFEQEQQGIARMEGGLGMGLALVRGLVNLHNGNVSANSAGLNEGSEFVVRFPLSHQTT